jgi:prepilin-type N-terminal cleavage/methylation domain-containing protein
LRRAACVSAPRRPHTRRAFSIIEITIVLMIIAVVSGLAIIRFNSATTTYRLDLAARRVMQDIQLAQTRARTTCRSRSMQFLDRDDSYHLIGESPLKPSDTDYRVTLSDAPFNVKIDKAKGSDAGTTLTFDGWGEVQQGFEIVISAGSQQRTITIKQTNGAVSVANQ